MPFSHTAAYPAANCYIQIQTENTMLTKYRAELLVDLCHANPLWSAVLLNSKLRVATKVKSEWNEMEYASQ